MTPREKIASLGGPQSPAVLSSDLVDWLKSEGIPDNKAYELVTHHRDGKPYLTQAFNSPSYLQGIIRNINTNPRSKRGPGLKSFGIDQSKEEAIHAAYEALKQKLPPIESSKDQWIVDDYFQPKSPPPPSALDSILPKVTELVQELKSWTEAKLQAERERLEASQVSFAGAFHTSAQEFKDQIKDQIKSQIREATDKLWLELGPKVEPKPEEESNLEPNLNLDPTLATHLVPKLDPNFYFDPEPTRALRLSLKLQTNALIVGHTGCGKTDLIQQIFAKLNRPIARVNMNGDVKPSDIIGSMGVNEKGTFFRYGPLPLAMQGGYPFLADEIDYMPPHVAAVFNPVTERKGRLFIPDTGETIFPSPGFFVLATANTGGKGDGTGVYTGTEVLNTAFLDRFSIRVRMTYLPESEEIKMLETRFPNSKAGTIPQLVRLAAQVRKAFIEGQLTLTLSTRKLIETLRIIDTGEYSLPEALELTLTNAFEDDELNLVTTLIDRVGIKG